LVEYKKEAFLAFESMDYAIKSETIEKLFKIQIVTERAAQIEEDLGFGEEDERNYQLSRAESASAFEQLGAGPAPQAHASQSPQGQSRGPSFRGGPPPREKPRDPVIRMEDKVGRNDPCPCGSGKKFKKCHGQDE
jgi:preprotein translocase subunit SecA